MPWVLPIDEMEAMCHELEKALNACGYTNAVAIVRSKFAESKRVYYVDDVSKLQSCDLHLLDWSSLGDIAYSLRLSGVK